jgi:hypothetical protein
MQYTAASFAGPVLGPFAGAFQRELHSSGPEGFFPTQAHWTEHLKDRADGLWRGLTRLVIKGFAWAAALQRGGTRRYLVYVLVTMVALLAWQLAWRD